MFPKRLFAATLRTFSADDKGAVFVLFAFLIVPVLAVTGAALDFGRAYHTQGLLQKAGDAAIDDALRLIEADHDAINGAIKVNVSANLSQPMDDLEMKVKIPAERDYLEVTLSTTMSTTLLAMIGHNKMEISTTSRAQRAPGVQQIELKGDRNAAIASADTQMAKDLWRTLYGTAEPPESDDLLDFRDAVLLAIRQQGGNTTRWSVSALDGGLNAAKRR